MSLSFGFFVILTLVLGKRKFQVKSNKFSWKNSNKAGWVVDEESVCCWNCFFVSLFSVNIAVTSLWWESSNITSHFLVHRYDKLFLSWESWSVLMKDFSSEQWFSFSKQRQGLARKLHCIGWLNFCGVRIYFHRGHRHRLVLGFIHQGHSRLCLVAETVLAGCSFLLCWALTLISVKFWIGWC